MKAEKQDNFITELEDFKRHLDDSVSELLDDLDKGLDLTRFDIKIGINGKEIAIPMHADVYNRLVAFIEEEIEEANL
jgi:hypothetical protein